MKLEKSPFPPGWWGTSLENVGLADKRPDVGTYGRYEQSGLPALPVSLDGRFSWLLESPAHGGHIGVERQKENSAALPKLEEACTGADVTLPSAFLNFFAMPQLHTRIRSNTDCFLDLAYGPVPCPVGEGVLIRFLADSQGCIFWYLFVPNGLREHAVVSSPDFYGPEYGSEDFEDKPDPDEIVFAEESFEAFMCRFWIENELWFSEYDGAPISDIGRQYLESYRASPPKH